MSFSSNGSPHSGQNLGGFFGSSGSQPHLSQRYNGSPAGFGFPHSIQNFPLFTVPQLQVQPSAGFGFPHSMQNFPVFTFPQAHVPASRCFCRLCVLCHFLLFYLLLLHLLFTHLLFLHLLLLHLLLCCSLVIESLKIHATHTASGHVHTHKSHHRIH